MLLWYAVKWSIKQYWRKILWLFWNLLWIIKQKFHSISEIKSKLFLVQYVSRIYSANKICLIKRFFLKVRLGSWWDGSVGKGTCCQVWQSEFNPWNPHDRRREQLLKLSSGLHSHTAIHACTYTNKYILVISSKLLWINYWSERDSQYNTKSLAGHSVPYSEGEGKLTDLRN